MIVVLYLLGQKVNITECEEPRVNLEYKDLHVSLTGCVSLNQVSSSELPFFLCILERGWELTCDK